MLFEWSQMKTLNSNMLMRVLSAVLLIREREKELKCGDPLAFPLSPPADRISNCTQHNIKCNWVYHYGIY